MVTPLRAEIIVGANFGDEGKGIVSARCATEGRCLTVLTNGGAQRAHTVRQGGRVHIFQHFGSGTFSFADTYFCREFICNPMQFAKEYQELAASFAIQKIRCFRHPECRWTTPFDMMANQMVERCRGEKRHGSCGMGIWNTVLRFDRRLEATMPIGVFDALPRSDKIKILLALRDRYTIDFNRSETAPYRDAWQSLGTIEHFLDDIHFFCVHIQEVTERELFPHYDRLIFENGQGLLLASDPQNPHTTPSETGCQNAIALLQQIEQPLDVKIHYVTRSYLTRHGAGALAGERARSQLSADVKEDETNQYNPWQGEFRYAPLELESLSRRILSDAAKAQALSPKIQLDVTHLDELDLRAELQAYFQPKVDEVTFADRGDV